MLRFFFRFSTTGAFAFAALVLSLWVWPETKSLNLPNSMEEAERVAMTRNPWLFWKNKKNAVEQEPEPKNGGFH